MKNRFKAFIAMAYLFIMLVFAWQQTRAPAVSDRSDLDFEAIGNHIAVIAARPHPMGSDANRQVRDYIVDHFESLGLETEIQRATVVYRHPSRDNRNTVIGNVENIIARLPGRMARSGGSKDDLVVMAHYDSRPLTPGAADDASSTAAMMEVARLMVQDPAPARDVVFLVTDGEEMGLLGAQGFFRQHPAAQSTGLVLNFEARGSTGASTMFETTDNNAWLVRNLVETAPDLVAGSLSYEIYRRMPNDTDMSVSKGEGVPGLNFGFVGGLFDYHAMTDTPQNLDRKSLAQQSNYMLATARHFAHLEDWDSATVDLTYFNLFRGVLVSYSQSAAVLSGLLVLAFGAWVFVRSIRQGNISPAAIFSGLLASVVLIIIVGNLFESMIDFQQTRHAGIARLVSLGEWPLAAYFITTLGVCLWFCTALRRGFGKLAAWLVPLLLALLSLAAGRSWPGALVLMMILVPALFYLDRRRHSPDLWAAGITIWWLLTAVALYLAPNASYILVWPLLAALVALLLQRGVRDRELPIPLGSAVAGSFIPLLLLTPMIIMAYLALGITLPQMIMIVCVVTLLLAWPLVRTIGLGGGHVSNMAVLATGVVLILYIMFARGFDPRHPAEESLFLAVDVDAGRHYWASLDAVPGSWSGDFLGENARTENLADIIPGYEETVKARDAKQVDVEAARLDIKVDRVTDGGRQLSLQLRSPAQAEYINLLFPRDLRISAASVNGHSVEVPQQEKRPVATEGRPDPDKNHDKSSGTRWWRWRWYGLPEQGADIELTLEPGRPLTVKVVEIDYGLPAGAPPRPGNVMPRKYTWSDSRVMYRTVVLD